MMQLESDICLNLLHQMIHFLFTFHGDLITTSLYGGIMFMEEIHGSMEVNMSFFNKGPHRGPINISVPQNVYFTNNVKLFMYSYRYYSEITILVKASYTSCSY